MCELHKKKIFLNGKYACFLQINKHFLDMTSRLNTLSIIVMKTESFTNTQKHNHFGL